MRTLGIMRTILEARFAAVAVGTLDRDCQLSKPFLSLAFNCAVRSPRVRLRVCRPLFAITGGRHLTTYRRSYTFAGMREQGTEGGLFRQPLGGFQTKADLVYERLRDAILGGDLRPGERINIDALARQMGISKIPLREAVQRLIAQGLAVQPNPHAGALVAPLSLREMRGVYLAREALEGVAARVAAQHITDAELAELEELHAQMEFRLRQDAVTSLSELNRRFHTMIASVTRYATLKELIELTLLRVVHFRIGVRIQPAWDKAIAEHSAILRALRSRDPEAAEQAAREHVQWQLGTELRAQLDPQLIDLADDRPEESVAAAEVSPNN